MEGRGGRRRSRSFAGPTSSPRSSAIASPAGPSQQAIGGAIGSTRGKRKRKRSLSGSAVAPAAGADSESTAAAVAAVGGMQVEGEGESLSEEAAEREREREREAEDEQEAAIAAAKPAVVFCRIVDALQRALKSGAGAGAIGVAALQGTLEVFLSGGDDFLQAGSRAAHSAYESAIAPVSSGGGVEECINAMGLRGKFASAVWLTGEREEVGRGGAAGERGAGSGGREEEKRIIAACRDRVMCLLCEGELFAVTSSRSS